MAAAKVFVSGTSGDLGTFRRAVSETLVTMGVLPVVQEHFSPNAGTVAELLEQRIEPCDAVICLVGERYGIEPRQLVDGATRRSYSQMEYDLAISLGKPVFLFLSGPQCDFDPAPPESADLQELQSAFRERLRTGDRVWTQFRSRDDLVAKVMLLRFDPGSIAASINSRLSVLLFTDLVNSTGMKARLGDDDYAQFVAIPHNQLFRDILRRYRDAREENYTGDGFLATFERVQDGVRTALLFQDALDRFPWAVDVHPKARIGIHLGQVTRVPGADAQRPQIASHSADLCARLMSLGEPGQILLTRAAFDNARQYLRVAPRWTPGATNAPGSSLSDIEAINVDAPELRWLSHGRYVFQGREEPMEVFEVGVVGKSPLTAPPNGIKAKQVDSREESQALGWQPGVGQEIPDRNGWCLERKLGVGEAGEVWLARNTRTRRLRVFKFCLDPARLSIFRDELAISVRIKEVLGDLESLISLHDVRLDQRPYYLECDYASGGNLRQWIDRRGGCSKLSLSERVSLFTEVARAVATLHRASSCHGRLKPSNMLLTSQGIDARVLLADVRGGEVATDLPATDGGEESTVHCPVDATSQSKTGFQRDLAALGSLLFQLLCEDFDRPLGSDWRRVLKISAALAEDSNASDAALRELLSEDLAASIGEMGASARLVDATQLVDRLERLPARLSLALKERRGHLHGVRRWIPVAFTLVALLVGLAVLGVMQMSSGDDLATASTP